MDNSKLLEVVQPIDALKKKMEKEALSVSRISKETGIDSHRLYKWVQGKSNPKHDDLEIIRAYLDGTLEKIQRKAQLGKSVAGYDERLLRIEAHIEVYESAIATLLSESKADVPKRLAELRSQVQSVVGRRLDELRTE